MSEKKQLHGISQILQSRVKSHASQLFALLQCELICGWVTYAVVPVALLLRSPANVVAFTYNAGLFLISSVGRSVSPHEFKFFQQVDYLRIAQTEVVLSHFAHGWRCGPGERGVRFLGANHCLRFSCSFFPIWTGACTRARRGGGPFTKQPCLKVELLSSGHQTLRKIFQLKID